MHVTAQVTPAVIGSYLSPPQVRTESPSYPPPHTQVTSAVIGTSVSKMFALAMHAPPLLAVRAPTPAPTLTLTLTLTLTRTPTRTLTRSLPSASPSPHPSASPSPSPYP